MCCHNRAADPTYADFELITDEPSNIIHSQHNIAYTSDACNYDTVEDYTVVECKKCHGPDKPSGDSYNDHPTATNFLVVRATFSNDPPTYYARNDVDKSAYEPFCLECHDGQNSGAIYQFSGPVPRSGGQPDQAPPTDPSDWTTTQPGPTWSVPAVPLGAGTPYFTNYAGSGNGHGRTTGVATGQNMGLTCLAGSSDGSIYGCHNAHSSQNRFLVDDFFGTDNVNWGDMMVATCYTTNHSDSNACHADLGDPGIGFHSWSSPRVLHDNSLQDVGKGERASDGMSLWRTNLPPSSSMTITTNTAITDVMPYFNDGGALNLASAQNEAHLRQNRVGAGNRISGEDWLTCMSCHDPHGTGALGGMLRDSDTDFSIQEPDYSHPLCAQCHD